jgi:hypothetical protein
MHHNSVILLVCNGKRPIPLPDQLHLSRGIDDDMWLLMEACWNHVPSDRLTATAVVQRLRDKLGLIKYSRPQTIQIKQSLICGLERIKRCVGCVSINFWDSEYC